MHYGAIGECGTKCDIIRFTFLKDHASHYEERVLQGHESRNRKTSWEVVANPHKFGGDLNKVVV